MRVVPGLWVLCRVYGMADDAGSESFIDKGRAA
jgi:hypothetical protein